MNILISSGGRRDKLISYFKTLDEVSSVHVADMDKYAPSFEQADVGHFTPKFNSVDYKSTICSICTENNIDVLISLNDFELPILAEFKQELNDLGISVVISDKSVIEKCWDKRKTTEFLQNHQFSTPQEYQSVDEVIAANDYPIIIKPRFGTASIGVEVANSEEELRIVYAYSELALRRSRISTLPGGMDILLQEKVEGEQYAVDIINDLNAEFCGAVIKRKLGIRGGDASLVVTEHHDHIHEWCKRLSQSLGHIGNLDIDIIVRENDIFCVDLNPRFGGAYPFSHLSGVNLPLMITQWAKGIKTKPIEYQAGVVTARTENYLRLDNYIKLFSDLQVGE